MGAMPPAEMAEEWMLKLLHAPTPQVRGQNRKAVNPVAWFSSLRHKRDRPTAVTNVQEVGAESIAGIQPVGQCQSKRRCRAPRPQEEVF